jgi:hypothetical protein
VRPVIPADRDDLRRQRGRGEQLVRERERLSGVAPAEPGRGVEQVRALAFEARVRDGTCLTDASVSHGGQATSRATTTLRVVMLLLAATDTNALGNVVIDP